MANTFNPADPVSEDFSFEFSDTPEQTIQKAQEEANDAIDEAKEKFEVAYTQNMQKLEKLILPLLYNLIKNPEKDYIKWPDRTVAITKQIDKITSLTRKPLDI
jgi:hypothetical protein